MEKKLLSKNILSNVQENTPTGVISFSSSSNNLKQNIYTILSRTTQKTHETKRSLGIRCGKVAYLCLSLIFIFSVNFKANAQNTCLAPQVITSLPYTLASSTTCGTVNDYTTTIGGSTLYVSGEDRIFRFVPATSGSITISVTQPSNAYLGMFLYTGCPFTAYIGGVQNNTATKSFTATVTAGTTYFLMLDHWAAPTCSAFTNLTISAPAAAFNPCTTIPTLTCGAAATSYSMAGSAGAWNTYGGAYSVPGQEKLFQFTPTVTGSYAVTMSASTGYNDFFWKAASVGCNATSWTYVNDILGTETWNVTLTAGVAYYFMMDDEDIVANTGTISVACLAAGCSGTPTAGTAVTSATAISCSGTTNLSVTGSSTGSGLTYQWQQSFNGGAYANIAGATAATYTTATLTAAGTYVFKCIITCTASGGTATSAASATLTLTYSAVACLAYCTPSQPSGCSFDYISNVTFSTINRSSTCDGASTTLTVYPTPNPTITQGSSYAISVSTGGDLEGAGVWIDWNQNGTFDVATEQILSSYAGTNPATYTATVTVPVTATVGTTRMRVRCNYSGVSSPCTAQSYGECEDYYVTIAAGSPCSGTPAPGATLTSSASVATGGTVNLSLSTPPTGSGLTYQWQSGPTATGAWTNIGTSAATYTATVSATTWYRCIVTCSGVTGTSTPVQVTVVVANNIPLTGFTSVACGTSTAIYDNGGAAGNYGTSASGYIVLNNAVGSTSVITLSGTYSGIETCCDNFKIYSGSGTGGTLLYTYGAAGSGTISTFSSAAGQTITIQFNSDGSVEGAGIALNAVYSGSCAVPACSGTPAPGATIATPSSVAPSGTSVLTLTTATTGSGVTYQWQSAASSLGPWSNVTGGTGATTASYTTAALTSATWFRCQVTCSGVTGTSTPVEVGITYCTPPAYVYACGYNYTANVTTTGGLTNFANTTACTGPFTNYSATISASQIQGGVVNMSLLGAYSATAFSVWIDYNDNFVFESSEKVITLPNAAGVLTAQATSFTVPASAPSGTHRMRVRCEWNGVGAPTDPCTQGQYGETEDYGFTVIVPSPPVISSFSPTSICPGNTVTITGSNFYGVTGVTINGVTATYTVVSATSITATVPSTTSGTIAVTNSFGTGTSAGTLTINSAPATPVISVSPSATIGLGGTATLTATTTGGTINWYKPMGTLVGTGTTFTTPAACVAGTHTYYAQEAGATCPSVAASQIITVNPLLTSTPSNGIICSSGGSVTLNANVTGGTGFNWSPATGLSSTTAGITIASPTVTTAYTFTCTTTACGALSGTFNVGVIAPTAYTPTATPATLCTGGTSLLASNLLAAGFSATSIAYSASTPSSPVNLTNAGAAVVTPTSCVFCPLDDASWQNIPIGFNYNFFGSSYNVLHVGTNSNIQFGTYNGTATGGLGDFLFTATLPDATEPLNMIAAAAVDLNAGLGGVIRYWTQGIAPTRVFVVEWNAVPGYLNNGSNTTQIKLFETTGNVELHVLNSSSTAAKVVGLQNFNATIGTTAVSTTGTITNSAWRFIPGATYGFQWSTAGAAIGGATSTTYTTPTLTTPGPIVYTVSALNPNTGCATSNNVTVTVNASPAAPISGGTVTNCSNITPQTLTATAPIGCVVDWYGAPAPFGGSNPVLLSSSSTYSTSTAGTYYAVSRNTITGCTSGGTVIQYIQTPVPALPTATTAIAYCQGAIASALSATALAGNSINWYNSMGGAAYTVAPIPSTVTSGATNYWAAQVSGTNGCVSNLLMITVTVNPSPAAPVAAAAGPYCQNDIAPALSATAAAGNTLQWYTSVGGTASGTAPTPSTVVDGTTDYYVAQMTAAGCLSPLTTISVVVNPTLTASVSNSASSTSACGGAAITFTAIPANGGTAPTYQWYVGGVSQAGETGLTYTIASPIGGEAVYVEMISNATPCLAAATVLSNTVTLTTTPSTPSVSIAVSGSSTVCFGSPITFSVASSSSLGATPSYQWQIDGFDVAGETNSTFTTVDVYPGSYVSLNVSSSILPTTCLTVVDTFSNSIFPTILDPVFISPDPISVSACLGTTQTFTVGAFGSGTLTYQWQKGGVNITGNPTAITSTLTISPIVAGDAAVYTCVVTGTCGPVSSAGATLTIDPNTAISAQPVAVTQCEAGLVTFTVTASGAGTLSYQWRKNGTNIIGANSASYSIAAAALTDAGNYSVVVGGTCGSVTSVNALLTVNPSITITAQPVSLTLCAGATANFSVTASGTGTLTYKWRFNGTLISGATSSAYSIASITAANAGNYTVSIISSCGTVLSSTAVLTVNPVTAIVTQPVSVTPCNGSNTMFFVTATGTGALTYQWKRDGVNIPSSNNDTLNLSSVSSANAGTYSCVVSGGTCGTSSASSTFATLTILPNNTIALSSGAGTNNQTKCQNQVLSNITFSSTGATGATVTGLPTGVSGSWLANVVTISGTPSVSGSFPYTVTLTGGCGTITATGTITVNALPVVAVSASATTICSTDPAVSITASGATSYSWNTGASTAIISVTPVTTTTYTVTGTNSFGCTSSSTITINVNPTPAITCPSTITVAAGAGSCSAVVTYAATSTTPGAVITYSIASGSTFNVGTTAVTATATSAVGCVSTCTFNVVVTSAGLTNWLGSASTDWFDSNNWCGGVPTAATDVVIAPGTTFSPEISAIGAVCKNININSGASLTMNSLGYLTVSGNWVKAGTFTATAGSVNFAGASAQTITGGTTFFDFDLNNAAGLTLASSSSIFINGDAQLNTGIITTGANVVTVSATGSLSVTSGYVNGFLTKTIDVGSGVFQNFEVGNATTYTPISYYFNDVTTAGTLKVNTVAGDHPNISTSGLNSSKTINRYWNTVKTGLVYDYYDLDVNYQTSDMDAGFVETYAGAKVRVGSVWSANSYAANYAATNYLNFTGLTVIGALQIGVFNPVPLAYSVTPDYGYLGTTSNLVVSGNGFLSGVSSVNAMADVTINSTTVNSDTTLTLNISVSPTATVGSRSFAITNASPFGGVSDSLTISIRPAPVASFYANRTTIGCELTGTVEYMNYSTDGASYLWDFGAGATPATATGYGPYTVSYSTTGFKTVSLIAFSPLGNDTVLRTNYVSVTHLAPAIPASISGPTSICSSGPNKIYSVPLVAGITNYVWTVPAGAAIVTGAGTRTITVSFIPSYTTGTLFVKQENGCGESPTKSLVINGLPPAPASISGPTNICSLVSATYTVTPVVGATSYAWTLPTGVTTLSGTSSAATTGTTLTVYFAPGAGGYISVSSVNVCSSSPSILLLVTGTSTLVTPVSLTGPTSSCGLTTGTYTVSAVAGATGYEWTFPAGVTSTLGISPVITSGTSITLTYGGVASGTLSVRARNTCATSGTKTLAFTNSVVDPASVSGPTNICGISTGTYTVSAVTGATGYVWTLSAGVTSGGASTVTTTGTTLTVDYGVGTTSGTISVAAANACVTSADASVAFNSSGGIPPAMPGVISGPTAVCNLANAIYSFTAVSGATSYTWTLPAGVTGGPSSTVITIDPSLYVSFAGFTSGSISVTANNCSSSAERTLALTTVPATPASISGATVICASASQTYTVATVAGSVTDYIWTLPAGVTYGGLSGVVSIPAAISGANTITVDIAPSFTSGVLSVKADNTCGTSVNRSITLSSNPLTPGAITGPVVACGLSSATYSIVAVSGATSYTWTLPAGYTLASSSTGLSNTITVDIASFTSGTLSVVANGVCGSSAARTLAISNTTATPTNLVGSTFVCGLFSATYTATAVSGATGYTWTLPAGVSSAGVYTSVTTTGNSLPVAFDAGFTSGILSVVSNSTSCGSSLPKTITISRAPLTPATLSGSTNICNLSTATYTVSATTNAVSYTWTLPTGVTSGGLSTVTIPAVSSGSNTITVNFAAVSISGTIAVTANSACGSSAPKTLTFTGTTAPGTPTAITGSAVVCASTSGTYTATVVVGAISYTWTLPAGVTSGGVGSSVTTSSTSIALDFGSTFVSGSITVKANNHCTTSAVARTLALTTVIGTAGVVTGPTVVCGLTSATYTVAATVGAVSYTWTLPAGVTAAAGTSPVTIVGSNTITVNFGTFTSGSLSVKANSACATSVTARTLAISKLAATPGLVSGPTNVCGLTTATYSVVAVAGATGYKWTVPADLTIVSGQGTNTINVSIATGPGSTVSTSSLSVRDTNECGQSAARSLTLSNCHSYSAFSADNADVNTVESSLYPNPSAGNFNVQYNSAINSELIIEMYDVLGKLVFSELEVVVEGENIFRYNQADLQKGSYFIRLTDQKNNMNETKILIIQ